MTSTTRRFSASDRRDPLGLRALDESYSPPTAGEVRERRRDLPDDVLVSRCVDRLHAAGAHRNARMVARLSGPERDVLVDLERRDLTAL